jgi:hypothetical protein
MYAKYAEAMTATTVKTGQFQIVDDVKALATQFVTLYGVTDDEFTQAQLVDTYVDVLTENGSRGFTAPNGTVVILRGEAEAHDKVHESIHLLSADGGKTQIMNKYGTNLNEAFTEYFTLEACRAGGVAPFDAYTKEKTWGFPLFRLVGRDMAHRAYMDDDGMGEILEFVARRWMELTEVGETTRRMVPDAPAELQAAIAKVDETYMKWGWGQKAWKDFWNLIYGRRVL